MFTETKLGKSNRRRELMAKGIFGLMSLAIVVPLLLIIGYCWSRRRRPLLSWDFLTTNPAGGMRRGGIWSALLGTIYLVGISLLIAAPIGVLAAVYLNEYARESWFTRIINLAVVNLAGVPSIVHALFGLGRLRALRRHGPLHPGRLAHPGHHDPAGHHRQHQGGAGRRPAVLPRGLLERGGHAAGRPSGASSCPTRSAAS